jgi:probable LLM family oxidoreductase
VDIGVFTFADVSTRPGGTDPARRYRQLLEEIALADEVGLDVFGVGEHHRPDFSVSAPAVVLAAGAGRTSRIRLTSAVSVLSADDPVRVFQQFASLDLLSEGRAEIMAGRGALVEPFALFGHDVADYEGLFEEKLELLLRVRDNEAVVWNGRYRAPLSGELVLPRPVQRPLPVWVAVGGSPQSVVRAGAFGLPMALAILGGRFDRLKPLVDAYRQALLRHGRPDQPVAITQHGFIADTSQRAADVYYPADAEVLNRIGRERGMPPMTRRDFDDKIAPGGAYLVGSPQEVAEKIIEQYAVVRHQRTLVQLAVGSVPHRDVLRAIELLGTKVAPLVRAEIRTEIPAQNRTGGERTGPAKDRNGGRW